MRFTTLALALFVLSTSLHADTSTKQYVTLDGTRLLSKASAFASSKGTLKKGTAVMAAAPKDGYVKVSVVDSEKSGYLSVRALQSAKPKLMASSKKSGDASAEEVAAATKGFNKQIEAGLRSQGDNEKNYATLDRLLVRSKVAEPRDGLDGFREKGHLGEYADGGAQ